MQEHSISNLFLIFLKPLNQWNINYIVTGSAAAIIYGEPRLTHDLDMILEITTDNVQQLIKAFPEDQFYIPPEEVIRIEMKRPIKGHFNIIHHETGFKADIYLAGNEKLHQWAFENKRCFKLDGEKVWFAPPEYVIIRKLLYYREGGSEKHISDIAHMIEMTTDINYKVLKQMIAEHDLNSQWDVVETRKY